MHAYETEALATEVEAETRAFSHFSVETEDKTKTFSLNSQAVTRPRRLKFQLRRDRAEALLRLETASRPRRQDRGHIPIAAITKLAIRQLFSVVADFTHVICMTIL